MQVKLSFPSSFAYVNAPAASLVKLLPSAADFDKLTNVRVQLRNFPPVSSPSDLTIRFLLGSSVDVQVTANNVQTITSASS
eukprot:749053-Hanusia_phi.AAC.1